jgi:membrane-associated phospholipid phosphatase
MQHRFAALCLGCVLVALPALAPLPARAGVVSFARTLGNDFATQAGYPFRLAANDPARFSVGLAGIAALVITDPMTRDAVASPSFVAQVGLHDPAQWVSDLPSARNTAVLVGGIGLVGFVTGSARERETSVMLTEAIITSGVWTAALKWTAGRERPREAHEYAGDWAGPGALADDDQIPGRGFLSFPSGHTSGTFAVATVLAHQYPAYGIVPVLAYGTAAAMGYSRIVLGAHWLSDVAVGALLGHGCANQIVSRHEQRTQSDDTQWHLGVDFDNGHRGVSFSRRF